MSGMRNAGNVNFRHEAIAASDNTAFCKRGQSGHGAMLAQGRRA
jgi:hypothetical protein